MPILNLCHGWHRGIHNSLKYLKQNVLWNGWKVLFTFTKRSILDIWQVSEYDYGWHIGAWQICVIVKTKCFYNFNNNSKSKQNLKSFANWKNIEKEQWKTKSIRKVYQGNNDNKILYFYFLYTEKDIFCSKI